SQPSEPPDGNGHPLLPYLIHASVLLFLSRDLLAFEWLRRQPKFQASPLPGKIRQTPTIEQAIALLKSNSDTVSLAEALTPLQDDALHAQGLRQFRNHVTQWGIPAETDLQDAPFTLPVTNYAELSEAAVRMWASLQTWQTEQKKLTL